MSQCQWGNWAYLAMLHVVSQIPQICKGTESEPEMCYFYRREVYWSQQHRNSNRNKTGKKVNDFQDVFHNCTPGVYECGS